MKAAAKLLLITVFAASIGACERWSWPPYENSLRDLFAENKDQFEEVRQNMLADNLEDVSSADARGRGFECVGPGCPRTIDKSDEQLQAKYSQLIEERSIFRYTLSDGDFSVRGLPLPPTQGRDFYFQYFWSEEEIFIPHCDERKARLSSCGRCYVDLDSNWFMFWVWYPQDLGPDWDGSVGEGSPTPEEIREQTEMATDECVKAGWIEMGLEVDIN